MTDSRRRALARTIVGKQLGLVALRDWIRGISVRQAGAVDADGNVTVCVWLQVPARAIADYHEVRELRQPKP